MKGTWFWFFNEITLVALSSWALRVNAEGWSYEGNHGPEHWDGVCSVGKAQSPIDIPLVDNVRPTNIEPLTFTYYNEVPKTLILSNNGHTVTLTLEPTRSKNQPTVRGGGLPDNDKFQFAQLHFHWGSSDDRGSEHLIGGKSYPMELHLVHFNKRHGLSLPEAVNKGGNSHSTLAVLGIMFQIQKKDNPKLKHLIKALDSVKYVSQETRNLTIFTFEDLLPRNTDMFFRYNGSLTTPGCNEIVTWTVFKDPVLISSKQMKKFRKVLEINHPTNGTNSTTDSHSGGGHNTDKHGNDGGGNRHGRSIRDTESKGHKKDTKDHDHDDHDDDDDDDYDREHSMDNNYRPVQPLNNRTILDIDTSLRHYGWSGAQRISTAAASTTIGVIFIAKFLL